MPRHLLSLIDLSRDDLLQLVDRSVALASDENPAQTLAGKVVGLYFRRTSTRTRTSFTVAAIKLGAQTISYGPNDLQICTGESIEDTARVLACYLGALVVRTADDPAELRAMASMSRIPLINAMTSDEHPTQAISDFATLKRHFGRLEGLRLLYVGEGNNTAAALALLASRVPDFEATFLTPKGYEISARVIEQCHAFSRDCGGRVQVFHDMFAFPVNVDVVYTTRWQTTGTSKFDMHWRERFAPFRVSSDLMRAVSKQTGTVFMHDLPAVRGEDCDSAVIEGPQSIVLEQARQKLFSAMAVLEWCAS